MSDTGLAKREIYHIEKGPSGVQLLMALLSLNKGDEDSANLDRVLVFTVSPIDDREDTFTSHFVPETMIKSGDSKVMMRGHTREDRSLLVRANYRLVRGDGQEAGTFEEIED